MNSSLFLATLILYNNNKTQVLRKWSVALWALVSLWQAVDDKYKFVVAGRISQCDPNWSNVQIWDWNTWEELLVTGLPRFY